MNKHLIKSTHTSLDDAVLTSGMDLSYNLQAAGDKIRSLSRHVNQAWVVEGGDVYFVYTCDINILHKFEPFMSCMDNIPFSLAYVENNELVISDPVFKKNDAGRNLIKKIQRSRVDVFVH